MGPVPAVAATRLAVRHVLPRFHSVLVACSGGPDSVALAAAVAFEAARAGVRAGLVTVDHGLQAGSAEQARRVVELGRALGLEPSESVRVEVGQAGGPEGAAREARYSALEMVAARFDAHLLLGHTRDDQAETVLLGLGRGSGPRSVAGMQVMDGLCIRPFLGLDRATTVAACAAQDLPIWDDPMNTDPRFTRVRLRREVLPLLEDVLHGGVAASLARTAELLRDDLDALETWATEACAASCAAAEGGAGGDERGELDVATLAPLPKAVRSRVLRRWAGDAGAGPLTREHLATLDALITDWHGQRPVPLPGGVSVVRASARLGTAPTANDHAPQE